MKPLIHNRFHIISAVLAATVAVSHAQTTQTWIDANANNNWSAADANWDVGSGWTQGNHAAFPGAGETVTLTQGISAANLEFQGAYTVTGNTLTLASGSVITIGDGKTTTINSILAGGPVGKSGTGTLVLGGVNSFTGGVTVNSGVLQANSYSALSNGPAAINVTGSDNATIYHSSSAGSAATNVTVSGPGDGLAILKWNQDWWGTTGKAYNTYNDWTLTLNRAINFQSLASGKQIAVHVTGSGVAAGEVAVKVSGGTQVTWTSAMNAANNSVRVNDFTGNVWVTGNTKLQAQNRTYQTNSAAYCNGLIPDSATVIVDAGSTLQLHHGAETIGFLSGTGTVLVGTGTSGNQLVIGGGSTTPTTAPETLGTATFSGTFSTNQSALVKNGTGTQEFAGANVTYSTATNLNNGTLKLTKTTAWGSNITFGTANAATLQLNSELPTDSWAFSKQINGGGPDSAVEKVGAGTLFLTPAAGSSYAGTLKATQGTLYLNNSNITAPPAVSVAAGAVFGGTGTAGATTVAGGGFLTGGYGGAGSLTLGSLTFQGGGSATVTPSTTSSPITVNGTLTTSGTSPVTVNLVSLPGANGTYHLIRYGTLVGGGGDFVLGSSPRTAYLQVGSGFVDLVVDNSNHPVWQGTSSEWSTATLWPKNWTLSGDTSPTDFRNLDVVEFNNSATGFDVTVDVTDVAPGSMIFDNDANHPYTLAGLMQITGGNLLKKGEGTLTIYNGFDFPGGSTLEGGVVSIDTETALGTGPRTFAGGALLFTGTGETWTAGTTVNTAGGTISVDGAANIVHTGSLSGTGTLTKSGTGTLALASVSGTVTTPLNIAEGTLTLNYAAGAITYAGSISGTGGVLALVGTGANATSGLTLTGNNTFTGETHVFGRRVFLDSPTGNALSGNIVIKSPNWANHCMSLNRDEQIANTAVLRFENIGGAYEFRLNGKTETLGGIESIGGAGQGDPDTPGNWAMIENAGYDGGNDNNIPAGTLNLNVIEGQSHTFHGQLRNQNGGSNNGALGLGKGGPGTQTLDGVNIRYTGPTVINGGVLELRDTTSFASGSVSVDGGTLLINHTTGSGSGTGNSGTIAVASGGTLAGVGASTATVTVQTGGVVSPGIDGVGTLTLSNADISGTIRCQFADEICDQLIVSGALTMQAGATVEFSGTPTAEEYVIATYGTLAGAPLSITPPAGYTVNTATAGQIRLLKSAGGFADWAAANAPGQTMDQDHDNDGVDNGIEYFMGQDGNGFTPNPAPNANQVISWTMGSHYAGVYGTDYHIETSDDLALWTAVPQTGVSIDPGVKVSYTLPTPGIRKFARLVITGP